MIRVAFLAVALMVPALAQADQVWRWQDAAGRLHYSNVPERVPPYAEPVRTTIGRLALPPIEAREVRPAEAPRLEPERAVRERRPDRHGHFLPPGYPVILFNHGVELSDQVKQAHLLDALHVPWRRSACR
jgi:hypothetical protein